MKEFVFYLFLINFIGFLMMIIDKRKAIKKQWRISENSLMMVSIIGGSVGVLLGMYSVRHKTKHLKFSVGIPFIIIVQIILLSLYFIS